MTLVYVCTTRRTHLRLSKVAFAHGGDRPGASIEVVGYSDTFTAGSYRGLHSEPLCLDFRPNCWNNDVLLGHRDGSVTVLDFRSHDDVLFAHASDSSHSKTASFFGSAASVRPLKRDDNLVVVKGSFGTCRLLDIRKLSNNIESARHRQSTVLELSLSNHIVHKTKSTRCTGLAVDQAESIAVAPFAARDGDIQFAIWDICSTGRLLRTLNVNNSIDKRNSDRRDGNNNTAFCELSDVVTCGSEMMTCDEESEPPFISCKKSWGLWFKTNLSVSSSTSIDPAPLEGGGIHHMLF